MRRATRKFTFIWLDQAKPGFSFVYEGMVDDCKVCPYMKVCHMNLTPKILYTVVKIKEKEIECKVFGKKARLVEVKNAQVEVALEPKHAIEGALIKFKPQDCVEMRCERFDECVPNTLDRKTSYKVVKVNGSFRCPTDGRQLIRVSLLPSEAEEAAQWQV